jgi:hypothetical protein
MSPTEFKMQLTICEANVDMFFDLKSIKHTAELKKKTGNEIFPNVNLVLNICELIVYLAVPIK